jgi:hypothetical protein
VQMHVSSIPVYVAPTYQLAEQQQQSVVHEVVGYIQVPMQASAQQVYMAIQVRACITELVQVDKATNPGVQSCSSIAWHPVCTEVHRQQDSSRYCSLHGPVQLLGCSSLTAI